MEAVQTDSITLKWLNEAPVIGTGVTWGVPWAEGKLQRDASFALRHPSGDDLMVQSWPTAFWPDGSVKWSAHTVVMDEQTSSADQYELYKTEASVQQSGIQVIETEEWIEVQSGLLRCVINKEGRTIIRSLHHGDRLQAADGQLLVLREQRSQTGGVRSYVEEPFHGSIFNTVVEQSGPLRAVIRIEGKHFRSDGQRNWLPFTLRLYFHHNQPSFRIVHTFIYDGNPHKDFIKGLGMTFKMPLHGPLYNRHVLFSGDTGFFRESPKNLATIRTQGKYRELYEQQFNGQQIQFDEDEDRYFLGLLDESAVWNDFKLMQLSADHYAIEKRTKEGCSWLTPAVGQRSSGYLYAGSESGGMGIGLRHFWEKHPSALEVTHMAQDEAKFTIWFWSPDAQPMDLRHYDTETHLESSYEGFEEMRSTPYGVANTNEVSIYCYEQTPSITRLQQTIAEINDPALLVCEPAYFYNVQAFGKWSLPDRSTAAKAQLEDQLDAVISFYQGQIEQRKWYGFWHFGDVMHSYDRVRHTWNYDLGGCAWQNTELAPNMWLWLMFMRTGRHDIFRMAEAMTRHNSEVDTYHIGEYAGLGSRHNVIHWGCGCKEARIGMAGLHRYYYYLTVDERIGDIMDEVKDSDFTTHSLDPMRSYLPKGEHPTHARVGPDWSSFSSNWMTRWERFEDEAYRDKLMIGINYLKQLPHRLLTGPIFGYDAATGQLYHIGDDNWGRHLMIAMGAPQVWIELAAILKDPEWEDMLAEFGEFYHLPNEEKARRTGGDISGKGSWEHPVISAGIVAYAAYKLKDEALARFVWRILVKDCWLGSVPMLDMTHDTAKWHTARTVDEAPELSTNTAAQWSLNTIMSLELIGDTLPPTIEEV